MQTSWIINQIVQSCRDIEWSIITEYCIKARELYEVISELKLHEWEKSCILWRFVELTLDSDGNVLRPKIQRTRDAIITSSFRQNDVVTSFWRNNDVIIASCVHWKVPLLISVLPTNPTPYLSGMSCLPLVCLYSSAHAHCSGLPNSPMGWFLRPVVRQHKKTIYERYRLVCTPSDHQPHDCLLDRLFKRRSKKTLKFRVTSLSERNSPVTGEFSTQKASNAENVYIWWRHHGEPK